MQRVIHMALVVVMLAVGLLMSGCADDSTAQQNTTPFVVLAMDNGATGAEPYLVKDGVITLIKDINPGASGSSPYGFTAFNGKIYFSAYDGNNYGLWVTDGTGAGTTMLKGFQTEEPEAAAAGDVKATKDIMDGGPSGFTVFNGKLYFNADDGTNGDEPWVTDGTADGTIMLKNINPTAGSGSYPDNFSVFNGKLYFSAYDGTNGDEPWVTDGTAAGTTMLLDINPGSASSYPCSLLMGGTGYMSGNFTTLLFGAEDSTHGLEIWSSNGTATGTKLLMDLNPGTGDGIAGIKR